MKNYKIYYFVIPFLIIFTTIIGISLFIPNNKLFVYNNKSTKSNNINEEASLYYFATSKYDLEKTYIYVGSDDDFVVKSNIRLTGGTVEIEDGKVLFTQWGEAFKEYTLVRVMLHKFNVNNKDIILNSSIEYEDFVKDISVENATYKIFNNNTEITSGTVEPGMVLKFYYEEDEIDSYSLTNSYLELDNLNIKDNKYIISSISTVGELKAKIDTSGSVIVTNIEGIELNDDAYLTTNSKVKINLSNESYEYTVVILGDVTGSGNIFIGDVSKLYQYFKNTITMEECYVIAGDVTYDDLIEINDISKLYQYYMGVINSL